MLEFYYKPCQKKNLRETSQPARKEVQAKCEIHWKKYTEKSPVIHKALWAKCKWAHIYPGIDL